MVIRRVLSECPFDAEFIQRENRGLCATLNEGFARLDGKFFAYIGSDDVWLPEFLESRVMLLEKRPAAVLAYGYSFLIDEADQIIDSTENWGRYANGQALEMLLYPMIPASASVVYRRAALEKCAWNEDAALEDYELYLRLTALGEFALDERILSAWRIHSYNTSANFPLMMQEWLAAQNRVAAEIGLSREELRQAQQKLKFRCVADFIRNGHKKEAWHLFWENRKGAQSIAESGKMFLRFLIPHRFFQWRRKNFRRKFFRRKGILDY